MGYIQNTRKDFILIVGYDRAFLPALITGGRGTVIGPGGVFPELFVKMYDTFLEGNYELFRRLQLKQSKLSLVLGDGGDLPWGNRIEMKFMI